MLHIIKTLRDSDLPYLLWEFPQNMYVLLNCTHGQQAGLKEYLECEHDEDWRADTGLDTEHCQLLQTLPTVLAK